MFVLDTNILSAMMAAEPVRQVSRWISRQSIDTLFTTAISQAEILSGLAIMPAGRHDREALEAAGRAMFAEDFEDRVLPFDGPAAAAYAEVFQLRRQAGRPTATIDLMILAIARCQGAKVVTRNVGDFDGCGVEIVDPWEV